MKTEGTPHVRQHTGFVQILGSKTQHFLHTFSKTIYIFSRLKVIKLVINIDLEKCMKKAFAWCTANTWPRLNKTLLKGKKITSKALVVALKKKT